MKRKNLCFWICLMLVMGIAGCSGSEDTLGEEGGGGSETNREVWSFDVKIMLDRPTFKFAYGSSVDIVNKKLQQRFEEVRELYRGKSGTIYFDADIEFKPFFDESCVYDCSSEEPYANGKTLRGSYPYLVVFDGRVGDYPDEYLHSNWKGWGNEVISIFKNGKDDVDASYTYDILSKYNTTETLAHELGHARGVPDIYAMEVKENPINGEKFVPVECMMNICWGADSWSEYSQLLINRNRDYVYGDGKFIGLEEPFHQDELELKVTKNGVPLSFGRVTVYPEYNLEYKIETTPLMTGTLTNEGTMKIDPKLFFNQHGILVGTALIEVEADEKYYRFLPVYEFQVAYLKGEKTKYVVEMKI